VGMIWLSTRWLAIFTLILLIQLSNNAFASSTIAQLPAPEQIKFTDIFSFSFRNYSFFLESSDFNLQIKPTIIWKSNEYTLQQIKTAYPQINFKDYITKIYDGQKYKWALDINSIPALLRADLNYIKLHLEDANGLTWDDVDLNATGREIYLRGDDHNVTINFQDLLDAGFTLQLTDKRTVLIGNIKNQESLFLDPTIISFLTVSMGDTIVATCQMYDDYVAVFWQTDDINSNHNVGWSLSTDKGNTWAHGKDVFDGTTFGSRLYNLVCYYNHTQKKLIVSVREDSPANPAYGAVNEITFSSSPTEMLTKKWEDGLKPYSWVTSPYWRSQVSSDLNKSNHLCALVYRAGDAMSLKCVDTDLNVVVQGNWTSESLGTTPATFEFADICHSINSDLGIILYAGTSNDVFIDLFKNGAWSMNNNISTGGYYGQMNCVFANDDSNVYIMRENSSYQTQIKYCGNPTTTDCTNSANWSAWSEIASGLTNFGFQLSMIMARSGDIYLYGRGSLDSPYLAYRKIFYDNNASWSSFAATGAALGSSNPKCWVKLPQANATGITTVGWANYNDVNDTIVYYWDNAPAPTIPIDVGAIEICDGNCAYTKTLFPATEFTIKATINQGDINANDFSVSFYQTADNNNSTTDWDNIKLLHVSGASANGCTQSGNVYCLTVKNTDWTTKFLAGSADVWIKAQSSTLEDYNESVGALTINNSTGITSDCSTATYNVIPNSIQNAIYTDQSKAYIILTNNGNVPLDLDANGSDFISGINNIPKGNQKFNNTNNYGGATAITGSTQIIATNVLRGTYPTSQTHSEWFWLDVPDQQPAGNYETTLIFGSVAT